MVDVSGRDFNGFKILDYEVEEVSGRVQKRVVAGQLISFVSAK